MNEYYFKGRPELVRHEPYVDEKGVWAPVDLYTDPTSIPQYRLVMTKEMFQEAYQKYIVDGEREDNE